MKTAKGRVLDLFSGAGGMSLGFEQAGFEIVSAIDHWPDALETLRRNKPNVDAFDLDLSREADVDAFLEAHDAVDVVIGGPPCQGFSIAGKRDPSDPRNRLYKAFVRAIEVLRPSVFVMENVPTIASPTNRELFEAIIQDFVGLGYIVQHKVLLASQYGVPQNRRRMFIVGTLPNRAEFSWPTVTAEKPVTCREAISDLPEQSLTDGATYLSEPSSDYQVRMRVDSKGIFNHRASLHSQATVETIALVPDGGNYKDLPPSHQGIRNVNIAWTRFKSWAPSFTIDTGHRHHFHYEFNRVPTAREAARLQSFPDSYVFLGSNSSQLKQIGNAVPPLLASAIASQIKLQGALSV